MILNCRSSIKALELPVLEVFYLKNALHSLLGDERVRVWRGIGVVSRDGSRKGAGLVCELCVGWIAGHSYATTTTSDPTKHYPIYPQQQYTSETSKCKAFSR
jgi:hypothetical protein